jgi:hypothetical protein
MNDQRCHNGPMAEYKECGQAFKGIAPSILAAAIFVVLLLLASQFVGL